MTELDMNLVKKGLKEPRAGLIDQGYVHIKVCQAHQAPLAEHGWPVERTAEMAAMVEELASNMAGQLEAKQAAKSATRDEVADRAHAKALIGKIRLGASMVLVDGPVNGIAMDAFHSGGTLHQSTPKILAHLAKIESATAAIDNELRPYFKGESAAAMVAAVKDALAAAQGKQEFAVSSLPQETLAVYENKGRLLSLIEEVNKVAKLAFWERKDIAAQFNKDVLNRARKTRKPATNETASV
jgi:hypothetical protein